MTTTPGLSSEDRDAIMNETAHIPDRDQTFHRGKVATAAETAEGDLTGWPEDPAAQEEQIAGEDREDTPELDAQLSELGGRETVNGANSQGFDPNATSEVFASHRMRTRAHSAKAKASEFGPMRALLESRKRELESVIAAKLTLVREQLAPEGAGPAIDFNHPADMVEGDGDFERELSIVERERGELGRVNSALAKLTEGRFGDCERCGKTIPKGRLLAVPESRYCLGCQGTFDGPGHAAKVH